MVFRSKPLKFNALRKECNEFLKLVIMVVDLASKIEVMELQQVLDQVCNWQVHFVIHLTYDACHWRKANLAWLFLTFGFLRKQPLVLLNDCQLNIRNTMM